MTPDHLLLVPISPHVAQLFPNPIPILPDTPALTLGRNASIRLPTSWTFISAKHCSIGYLPPLSLPDGTTFPPAVEVSVHSRNGLVIHMHETLTGHQGQSIAVNDSLERRLAEGARVRVEVGQFISLSYSTETMEDRLPVTFRVLSTTTTNNVGMNNSTAMPVAMTPGSMMKSGSIPPGSIPRRSASHQQGRLLFDDHDNNNHEAKENPLVEHFKQSNKSMAETNRKLNEQLAERLAQFQVEQRARLGAEAALSESRNEARVLAVDLQQARDTATALDKRNKTLDETLSSMKKEVEALKEGKRELGAKEVAAVDEVNRLRQLSAKRQSELDRLVAAEAEWNLTKSSLESNINVLRTQLGASHDVAKSIQSELDALSHERTQCKERIHMLESTLEATETTLSELRATTALVHRKEQQDDNDPSSLVTKASYDALRAELETTRREKSALQQQLGTQQDECLALRRLVSEKEQGVIDLNQSLLVLQDQHVTFKSHTEQAMGGMDQACLKFFEQFEAILPLADMAIKQYAKCRIGLMEKNGEEEDKSNRKRPAASQDVRENNKRVASSEAP